MTEVDPTDLVQPAAVRLVADYARYLDERDAEAWVDLFTPDGEIVYGERRIVGHEALARFLDGTPRGVHIAGPPSIALVGDEIHSYSTIAFVDASSGGTRAVVNRDRMVRHEGRLRLRERRIELRADTLQPRE